MITWNKSEKPEAILLTMSKDNVEEWGGIELLDRFFSIHYTAESDSTYWYKIGPNFPRHMDMIYAYLVIHNQIRWRFNLVAFENKPRPDGILLYKDGRPHIFHGKFIVLAGPAVKSPGEFNYKGFQGFRYSQFIY